jgi:hypothetical protein
MTTHMNTLPELAKVKAKRIKMEKVSISSDIQPRLKISHDAIRRYKDKIRASQENASDPFDPVIVARIPGCGLTVVDGYHRYRAHEELGIKAIKVKIIDCDFDYACWLAAKANLEHGVPLIRKDHPEVFKRYIRAGMHRNSDGSLQSYRGIQKGLGNIRSHTTLRGWMAKSFPEIYAEMSKDGLEDLEAYSGKEHHHSYEVQEIMNNARGVSRCVKLSLKRNGDDDKDDIIGQIQWLLEEVSESMQMSPEKLMAYEPIEVEDPIL